MSSRSHFHLSSHHPTEIAPCGSGWLLRCKEVARAWSQSHHKPHPDCIALSQKGGGGGGWGITVQRSIRRDEFSFLIFLHWCCTRVNHKLFLFSSSEESISIYQDQCSGSRTALSWNVLTFTSHACHFEADQWVWLPLAHLQVSGTSPVTRQRRRPKRGRRVSGGKERKKKKIKSAARSAAICWDIFPYYVKLSKRSKENNIQVWMALSMTSHRSSDEFKKSCLLNNKEQSQKQIRWHFSHMESFVITWNQNNTRCDSYTCLYPHGPNPPK